MQASLSMWKGLCKSINLGGLYYLLLIAVTKRNLTEVVFTRGHSLRVQSTEDWVTCQEMARK